MLDGFLQGSVLGQVSTVFKLVMWKKG